MTYANIKIPSKHYVGMVKRKNESIPLGFITPWGTDDASTKRMATVDNWANSSYNGTRLPPLIIDNIPMGGFRLTTGIRSSSYGGADKWRIEDPRGFELEISSGNLAELISIGMIDRGEIADTCVWARHGQQNVLLSTSTDEYKSAVKNTEVASMSASWKDVRIGNTVLLQNNITGTWLGRMHGAWCETYANSTSSTENKLKSTDKKFHVIYVKGPDSTHKMVLLATPKLAAITDTTTISDAAAEQLANKLIEDKTCEIESSGYRDYVAMALSKINVDSDVTLALTPCPVKSYEELVDLVSYKSGQNIFIEQGEYLYRMSSGSRYPVSSGTFTGYAYSKKLFSENKLVQESEYVTTKNYWSQNTNWVQRSIDFKFNNTTTFYTASVSFGTSAGNQITGILK
jgi:hypothetical protein